MTRMRMARNKVTANQKVFLRSGGVALCVVSLEFFDQATSGQLMSSFGWAFFGLGNTANFCLTWVAVLAVSMFVGGFFGSGFRYLFSSMIRFRSRDEKAKPIQPHLLVMLAFFELDEFGKLNP